MKQLKGHIWKDEKSPAKREAAAEQAHAAFASEAWKPGKIHTVAGRRYIVTVKGWKRV